METRELFWSLTHNAVLVFYVIGFSAIAIFLWGFWRHIAKYRRGAPHASLGGLANGIRRMIGDLLTHRTLKRRDKYAGYAHMAIFFGFTIAFIGTAIITLDYDIVYPLFGVRFWKGDFYLLFSLIVDLGGLVLLIGIAMMMWRRATFNLAKLDYIRRYRGETELREPAKTWRREDWGFMTVLMIIVLTGFLQEAVRLFMERPDWAIWSPVGLMLANLFAALGMSEATAASIREANWWMHGLLALAFVASIPQYKAKHIIAVLGSLSTRTEKPLARLPREDEDKETAGVACISDFSWKDMLNFDACTKCGRCHEACPARNAGFPLSPRDLILDLRLHNDAAQGCPSEGIDLIGDVIDAETLWSCRSCGACQEICPVGIEHPAMIVQMRRQLVDRGEMDPLLQGTLDTIASTGNSFGESSRKRSAWARELEFEVKDIRETPAEDLWFVGDYASFDPRNQKVSRAFASLMKAAGNDFALLHEGERNSGNDVRRVGEEGLYETLVEENLEALTGVKEFSRIITTDPHSYNTIRNEYPEFGQTPPIEHYSSVLADLLRSGKLKVTKPLNRRVTFHDPCHLGRLNGGYDAPREVLEAIGCTIIEMPRNRDNSFCCGAGGGRIWIPDPPGIEKPSENRMHEASSLGGIDVFVTCCPKDLTMFEDARKTSGHESEFVVQDIAELVAEAVELESLTLKDLPPIADRLTDAIATRIAEVVATRLDEVLAAKLAAIPAAPVAPELAPPPTPEPPEGPATSEPEAPLAKAPVPEPEPEAPAPVTPVADALPDLTVMDWDNPAPVAPADLGGYTAPAKEGLRVLVTVKHAAKLGDEYEFTADGCDIVGDYLEHDLNEWDDAALEQALLLVEAIGGGEVIAVSIGPEESEKSLRKVLAKGADRAVRVWDDRLANADPVTIARAIAGIAVAEQPDLILSGTQSSDHAHGSTGTALARILGMPHGSVIASVEWDGAGDMTVVRELEGGTRHVLTMPAPAVLAIQTGTNTPRYATMRMIKQAKKKPLEVVDGSALIDGGGGYRVRKMYTPVQEKAQMLEGTAEEVAEQIATLIREKKGE
ncbi:heterodisulfide reductase-related iron-sulfur binding cluster [Roseovarius sp. 2305UL8-3]|uniref:heterodisulfide reductase-related iron-sulfur binding cluster n=1 Tax=Roseovarius conchicola TaxID=3121636 RepID=UPI003526E8B8